MDKKLLFLFFMLDENQEVVSERKASDVRKALSWK